MFGGLSKYARAIVRVVVYSIGLTIFLDEHWIMPGGNFLNNVIAGIVLYAASWLASRFLVRGDKGGGAYA